MRVWARLAIAIAILLPLTGCEGAAILKNQTPIGTEAWMADGCQYVFLSMGWIKTAHCRVEVQPQVWELRYGTFVLATYDLRDPLVVVTIDRLGMKTGQRRSDGSPLIWTDNEGWVTQQRFIELRRMAESQPERAQEAKAPGVPDGVPEWRVRQMMDEANARMAHIWLAPDCNNSYNGCL